MFVYKRYRRDGEYCSKVENEGQGFFWVGRGVEKGLIGGAGGRKVGLGSGKLLVLLWAQGPVV